MVGPEGHQVLSPYNHLTCPTCKNSPIENVGVFRRLSNRFSRLIAPAHKRVARMVGYCLTAPDESSMWQLSAILSARLKPRERAFLAVAILTALEDDEYEHVIRFMGAEA